ncbi:MAG: condensation domain-containing protein, partial [Pseudomonadota bacterium]
MMRPGEVDRLIADYRAGRMDGDAIAAVLRQRATGSAPIPLNQSQLGLFALERQGRGGYAVSAAFALEGVGFEAFKGAYEAVVRRWPVLGGKVAMDGDGLHLVPNPAGVAIEWRDARGLSRAARMDALQRERWAATDLMNGPFARALYLAGEEGEALALITGHHIVLDGRSMSLIVEAFAQHFASPGAPVTPVDAALYRQAVRAEHDREEGSEGNARLAHWRRVLDCPPQPALVPADGGTPGAPAASLVRALSPELTARLDDFSAQNGLFTTTVLMAVWQGLLARLSNQPDVIVGLPVEQREVTTSDLVGNFISVMPVRLVCGADPMRAVLRRLQGEILDGMGALLSYPRLIAGLGRSGQRELLASALFFDDAAGRMTEAVAGVPGVSLLDGFRQEGPFPLFLQIGRTATEAGNQYNIRIGYDGILYSRDRIDYLLSQYLLLLCGVIERPELGLFEHDLTGGEA